MSKRQSKDLSNICKHISRLLGNKKHAGNVVKEIQNWVSKSGSEWTVARLKALHQSVIRYASDETSKNKKFPCPDWISRDSRGFPKGHLGGLIKRSLNSDDQALSLILSVLRVYKTFRSRKVTAKQFAKFDSAIGSKRPAKVKQDAYMYGSNHAFSNPLMFKYKQIFKESFHQSFNFGGLNSAKYSMSPFQKRMKKYHPWLTSLVESTMVSGPWSKILKDMGIPTLDGPMAPYAGNISVIQEGGYKARVVAVPGSGIQVAFKPLHDALNQVLKSVKQDCTHDQESGIEWARKELRSGKVVHAVDLSSATDNFPLEYQRAVLEKLGYKYSTEFVQCCQMPWRYPFSKKGTISYDIGQPMGMFGSFALFAFSHHILVQRIEKDLGVYDTYRILGDDIVISNDAVHKKYMTLMNNLSIPISYDKCLDSDILTEFAGKVIRPKGNLTLANPPKNGKALLNVDQFLNYARATGSTKYAISGVPKQFRSYAVRLAALPVEYGGAGLNPSGLSLIDRLVSFKESSMTRFPLTKDLGSHLWELSLRSNPHVKNVARFVNDQFTTVTNTQKAILQTMFGLKFSDNSVIRASLQQLLDSEGVDESVVFMGSVKDSRLDSAFISDVIRSWQNSSDSITNRIESTFDSHMDPTNVGDLKPKQAKKNLEDALNEKHDRFLSDFESMLSRVNSEIRKSKQISKTSNHLDLGPSLGM